MDQKVGGAVPLFRVRGGAGSPSNTILPGPRPYTSVPSAILIYSAVWPQQTWTEIGGVHLGGSPSNTVWPGPRPTSKPSDIQTNRTVWPQ